MNKKEFAILPGWLKRGFASLIDPLAEVFVRFNIHPNFFTALGFVLSLVGAYFYASFNLRLGGVFILLGGLCDMLDGKVARQSGLSSKFGALFDSSLDRYAEVFMFLGLAFYFVPKGFKLTSIMIYLGLAGSMMVSYVRARAEGLGYSCSVGIMQRPERIVYIGVASLIHETVLVVVIWVVAVLANFTAFQRMYHVFALSKASEKGHPTVDQSKNPVKNLIEEGDA